MPPRRHVRALHVVFGCGLALAACSAQQAEPELGAQRAQLIGARPVSATAWPSVVWLETGCSATLMHERVVVFAAHCGLEHSHVLLGNELEIDFDRSEGTFALVDSGAVRRVAVKRCAGHPSAAIGNGADLAFCELSEALTDVPAVPPAVGCERSSVVRGSETVLVGYGFASVEDDMPGRKRAAAASVERIEREIVIGDDAVGSCRGDSGGPALVTAPAADDEAPDWRVLAVMSSGEVGKCGVGWYTDLAPLVGWLESQSGHDLTPCSDADGEWQPGPACRAPALDADGEPLPGPTAYSRSCGEPYAPPPAPASCRAGGVGATSRASHAAVALALACIALAWRRRGHHGGRPPSARAHSPRS